MNLFPRLAHVAAWARSLADILPRVRERLSVRSLNAAITMALIEDFHFLLEAIIGRKGVWRLSRKLYLLSRRDGSLDHLRNGELQLVRELARHASREQLPIVAIDVGANYGEWIDMVLQEADRHRIVEVTIHAFEPASHLADALLERASSLPEGKTVKIVKAALSREPGRAQFVFTGNNKGDHHLQSNDLALDGQTFEVQLSTLDIYSAENGLAHIDMIKIDAEGFDPFVIEGGRGLLRSEAVDLIQFEYGCLFIRTRMYLYDIFEIAKSGPYKVGRLTAKGIEVFDAWHADLERFYLSNYVLIHPRAMEWARGRLVEIDATNAYY